MDQMKAGPRVAKHGEADQKLAHYFASMPDKGDGCAWYTIDGDAIGLHFRSAADQASFEVPASATASMKHVWLGLSREAGGAFVGVCADCLWYDMWRRGTVGRRT